MKRLVGYVSFICLLLALVIYSACIKDTCGTVICNNGGICVNGTCTCPSGYEGDYCSKVWNEKFAGKWNAEDSFAKDNTAKKKYDILIDGFSVRDSFYIAGLADTVTKSILCSHTAFRSFTIPEQKIDTFLILKNGTGTIDSVTGTIKGYYALLKKTPLTDSTTKDTTVTVHFSWKR